MELVYPEHKHPHDIKDKSPNEKRIWICEECLHIFTDDEIRNDKREYWGHPCKAHLCRKGQRCEAHLEPYLPDIPKKNDNCSKGLY